MTFVTAWESLALTASGMPFGPKIANQKRNSTSAGAHAGLLHGRHVRHRGRAGRAGHRERLDLAALDQALDGLHRGDGHRHVAGDDVADRLAAALVGHVHGLHAGLVHEHLEVEMRDGADAGGGEVHLLRHGLRIGEQLRHGLDRHVVGDDQRRRRRRKPGHRVVLRDRIEVGLRFLVERLADGDRVLRKQQRVAVRIGGGDVVPGDIAAGAGPVLDDDRLAERLLQIVGNLPREGVGRAAGHEGDDEMDRLVGVGALRRRGLDGEESARRRRRTQRTNFSMTSSQDGRFAARVFSVLKLTYFSAASRR